jgi:hypothetical protein
MACRSIFDRGGRAAAGLLVRANLDMEPPYRVGSDANFHEVIGQRVTPCLVVRTEEASHRAAPAHHARGQSAVRLTRHNRAQVSYCIRPLASRDRDDKFVEELVSGESGRRHWDTGGRVELGSPQTADIHPDGLGQRPRAVVQRNGAGSHDRPVIELEPAHDGAVRLR